MLSKPDIQNLKRYRHVIANMIDVSIGYFTPLAALRAIQAHKEKQPYFCEWYMDIAGKRRRYEPDAAAKEDKELYMDINHTILKESLRFRHCRSHKGCLAIVDRNIAGNQSIGASWF